MTPRFSVIVPVYEQWHLVPNLLGCLAAQTLGADQFEIILADNGSANFAEPANMPPNARIIHCDRPGSYAARNAARAVAAGEWLVFTDADCLPAVGWLDEYAAAIGALSKPAILAGRVEMRAAGDRPNAYEMYDIVKGIPQERYVRRGYAATANLAVSARQFDDIEGFDASRFSGGDADFCRRATASGAVVVLIPTAVVAHPARNSWEALRTKARRVKGGQLTSGSRGRQAKWLLRTLAPPAIDVHRLLIAKDKPISYRLRASALQCRLWAVEIAETVRLLLGQEPTR